MIKPKLNACIPKRSQKVGVKFAYQVFYGVFHSLFSSSSSTTFTSSDFVVFFFLLFNKNQLTNQPQTEIMSISSGVLIQSEHARSTQIYSSMTNIYSTDKYIQSIVHIYSHIHRSRNCAHSG